jgi:hypothetical protein
MQKLAHGIFVEAGMSHTFLHDDISEAKLWKKLEKSLNLAQCVPQKLKNPLTPAMNPAGGIVSTARDLLKWNEFLRKNGYFKKLTKVTIPIGGGDAYGLGIVTNDEKNLFSHAGAIAAVHLQGILFTCVLIYDASQKCSSVGFDVLDITNIEDCKAISAMIDERSDILLMQIGIGREHVNGILE